MVYKMNVFAYNFSFLMKNKDEIRKNSFSSWMNYFGGNC